MSFETIILIVALIYSVVLHEVAHGYAAYLLGDNTARYEGRLTLNPISHLDPFGSVILPLLLTLVSSPFLFGWAKPVPYNPYNFRRGGVWGETIVAAAGPLTNVGIALVFALWFHLASFMSLPQVVADITYLIVHINLMLAVFNMIPVPPLDGSKVLSGIVPNALKDQWERVRAQLEHNPMLGFGIVFGFIILMGDVFSDFILVITNLLV